MASFAYRESHQRYYSDPELVPSMAQGCKVVQKPKGALNATWNTSYYKRNAASYNTCGPVYPPYTF